MTTHKTVVDNILSMLRESTTLEDIKKWHKGQPSESRVNAYPYGWVEWSGGEIKPRTAVSEKRTHQVFIVLVDRHVDHEKAEESAMDYAEIIEDVIEADRSLNGVVNRCWFSFAEKLKIFEGDYSKWAVRLTLTVVYFTS